MRSILIAAAILIGLAGPVLAQTPNSNTNLTLENLTPEQMKILAGKAAELKAQEAREAEARLKTNAPPTKIADVSEKTRNEFVQWSEIGTGIGKAMLATAKEIGVAAVDFANSGLGKLVIALIIFKLFGTKILGILVAIAVMSTLIPLGMRFMRPVAAVEYTMVPILWNAFQYRKKTKITMKSMDGDETTGRFFGGLVMIAIGIVVGIIALFAT